MVTIPISNGNGNKIGDSIPPCFTLLETKNEEVVVFPQRMCIC